MRIVTLGKEQFETDSFPQPSHGADMVTISGYRNQPDEIFRFFSEDEYTTKGS